MGFSIDAWITIITVLTMFSLMHTGVLSIIAMLVYSPGGYRFSDFIRVGLPMNLIILAANILIVNLVYPLTPLL